MSSDLSALMVIVVVATALILCDRASEEIITQEIEGSRKDVDITADVLHINGNYNRVMIVNDDVHLITIDGSYNDVFYPEGATPIIEDMGLFNTVRMRG